MGQFFILMTACASPAPTELNADLTNGEAPLNVSFVHSSEGVGEFWWDFGDGSRPTRSSMPDTVSHVYTRAGTHTVTVAPIRSELPDLENSATLTITITPGPLNKAVLGSTILSIKPGGLQSVYVSAFDQFNNALSVFEVEFRADQRAGQIDAGGRFVAGTRAGIYKNAFTAMVTDGQATKTVSSTVIILPGSLNRVLIDPSIAVVGVMNEQLFVATAVDRFGNAIHGLAYSFRPSGRVGLVDNEGRFIAGTTAGIYGNGVTVDVSQGTATRTAGATVIVESGILDQVVIEPRVATMQVATERTFSAKAVDKFGNQIPGLTYVFASAPEVGTVAREGHLVAGTESGTYLGSIVVTATDESITKSDAADITLRPGSLDKAVVSPARVRVAAASKQKFTATAFDRFGNPIPDLPYAFKSEEAAGRTSSTGDFVAGTTAGIFERAVTVQISQGSLAKSASADVIVEPGPLHTAVMDAGKVILQIMQEHRFRPTAFDEFGNVLSGFPFTFRSDQRAGKVAKDGVFVAGTRAGEYDNAVTAVFVQGTHTSLATADISVQPGLLDRVVLQPSFGALRVTEQLKFTAIALDAFGNLIPGLSTRFSSNEGVGLVSGDGVFTAGTNAGEYERALTVEIAQGSVTRSAKADIMLDPGPLDSVIIEPGSITLRIGQSGRLGATAFDAYGNTIKEAYLTWDVGESVGTVDNTGLLTAGTLAGAFESGLNVVAQAGDYFAQATALVDVRPDPLDSIVLLPVQIAAGEQQQLFATAVDRYGNVVDGVPFSWLVVDPNAGAASAEGMITAGEVTGVFKNSITVVATQEDQTGDDNDIIAFAYGSVAIGPGPLSQAVIAPDPVRIGMGMVQRLVAVGSDRFGNRIQGLSFEWHAGQSSGSIDANGLFTAGSQPGTFDGGVVVTVIAGDDSLSATTAVIVEPDRVVFMSDRDNSVKDIYLMDLDGVSVERLTSSGGAFPAWSPNGRRIAYHACMFTCEIVVMGDDGKWKTLLSGVDDAFAHWSPDGSKVAFASTRGGGGLEIYVTDVDGFNPVRLTTSAGKDSYPAWSPSGSQIVFSSERDGQAEIYVMDADGSAQKRLTENSATDVFPAWSPDGNEIVFESDRDGDFEIFLMDTAGGRVRQLTFNSVLDAVPTWSPDGDRILFHSLRDGNRELYLMDTNGGNQTRITINPAQDLVARWAPRKRGVQVNEDWIVIPGSSTLRPMEADEVTVGGRDAIVRIETDTGSGSGFIIDTTGLVLTNNHVVADAKAITAHLSSGATTTATLVGRDLVRDIALIQIDGEGLSALDLGNLSRSPVESVVLAMGHPFGTPSLVVTNGTINRTVTDKGRNITWIDADTVVQPGSSGGPLVNLQGNVIGMITAKFSGPGGGALALSVNTIGLYLEHLKAGKVIAD